MKEYKFSIRINESKEEFYLLLLEIEIKHIKIDDVGHSDQVIVIENVDGFNEATKFLIDRNVDFEADITTYYLRGYETKS